MEKKTTARKTPSSIKADIRSGLLDGSMLDTPLYRVIKDLNKNRLDNTAMVTETKEYTYRQMFSIWDKYARVFSAVGITGKNNSRPVIIFPKDFETISALFALNMTGTTVSLFDTTSTIDTNEFKNRIIKEKITDIIVTDYSISPEIADEIISEKEKLGIRNVIILTNSISRENLSVTENISIDINTAGLHMIPGLQFMDDLFEKYEGSEIEYGSFDKDKAAFIFHTSGTTKGIKKPIPFTNRGINASARFVLNDERFTKFEGRGRLLLELEVSHVFFFVDSLLVVMFLGCALIVTYKGAFSDYCYKDIEKYKANVRISSTVAMTMFSESEQKADLSNLELVISGGSNTSNEAKEQINKKLAECGCSAKILNGYGLSEAGGACILCTGNEIDESSVGYPLSGINIKIQDEDSKEFYDISDGERIGGLYINCEAMPCENFNDEKIFSFHEIDGKKYYCTNDLFKVNSDGSLSCCGRMNQFFVNNEGIKFNAGLIETALQNEHGINNCVILPMFNKGLDDTVPILFIETSSESDKKTIVKKALINTFIGNKLTEKTNLPALVVFIDEIPIGHSGKIDRDSININDMSFERCEIKPVKSNGILKDIILMPFDQKSDNPFFDYSPDGLNKGFNNNRKEKIASDPAILFKLAPSTKVFIKSVIFGKAGKAHKERKSEDNNCPSFLPWLCESENEKCNWHKPLFISMWEDESKEKPPFMDFFESFEKPSMSRKELEDILDCAQDWIEFFYKADRASYK